MRQHQKGQKRYSLYAGGVFKSECLKFVVYPKAETHDHRAGVGNGQRGKRMKGQGV